MVKLKNGSNGLEKAFIHIVAEKKEFLLIFSLL